MLNMNAVGRPRTGLDIVVQSYICEQLAKGRSLKLIAKDDKVSMSDGNIRYHLLTDSNFFEQYEEARNIGLDVMADELLEIADDGTNDFVEKENKDGSTFIKADVEHIQRSRLRTDVRKWYLSKLAPKRYGERMQTDITNSDGSLKNVDLDQVNSKVMHIIENAKQLKALKGKIIDVQPMDSGINDFI